MPRPTTKFRPTLDRLDSRALTSGGLLFDPTIPVLTDGPGMPGSQTPLDPGTWSPPVSNLPGSQTPLDPVTWTPPAAG